MKSIIFNSIFRWKKWHVGALLLTGGIAVYAVVASRAGSSPACGTTCTTNVSGLAGRATPPTAQPLVGVDAPPWDLRDLAGKEVSFGDFKGKVVILDFWATWCGPCREEIPGFVELQKQYGDKGLAVIGISMDQDGPQTVRQFVKDNKMNYTVVMGDALVAHAYGDVETFPTTIVIDRQGKITAQYLGDTKMQTLKDEIGPLIATTPRT